MDNTQEQPKKCFCARCFLPIDPDEKVEVEGQNFHRMCSTCCICRTIPTSLKMFYGHVFCNECFKSHVLNRFRGETPRMHSNSWWMQWAPGAKPHVHNPEENKENTEDVEPKAPAEPTKKCICARCLQMVDENTKVDIGGQSFHPQCCKCYCCHAIPTDNVKIYYGQVFCEECFHRHVLNRNKDNPTEFFKNCCDQWQNNAQFADNMREMMSGNKDSSAPLIFMMQGANPAFCRCGTAPKTQEWLQTEPRKSVTPATASIGEESFGTWDLSFEARTEASDVPESCNESANQENCLKVAAAEKIEKLTKYLHENSESEKYSKKWKNFIEYDTNSCASELEQACNNGWADFQDPKTIARDLVCPKCLWQCGNIFVNGDYYKKVCCGENSSFE